MKLVRADVSVIVQESSQIIITFHPGKLVLANVFDKEFYNSESLVIECRYDNDDLEMKCNRNILNLECDSGFFRHFKLYDSKLLLETETFRLLMKVEIEEYFEMQQKLISDLETMNVRNLIDYALDKRDFDTARKLVALCK
ncbi:hypothetical protein SFC08_01970 [Lysinibacillus halotolerans]